VRFDDDDKPKFSFRPRWRHLLYLVDLAVIIAFFFIGAWAFRSAVGEKKIAEGERLRQMAKATGERSLEQADSVVAAERARLHLALADSVSWAEDLTRRRVTLEATAAEQQRVNATLTPIIDQVLDLHYRSKNASAEVEQYEEDLAVRRATVVELHAQADEAARQLAEANQRHEDSIDRLADARSVRLREPAGVFSDNTGLLVRQDLSSTQELTNVEFQRNLWSPGVVSVGFSLGLGLGSQDVASSKQVGVVVTRPLIHRRLGLDLGAGYSVLTDPSGADDTGMYASASLRFSPFFKERFHLGLGARAVQEEVVPFVSIGVGRR
jgi:hypothetical protein